MTVRTLAAAGGSTAALVPLSAESAVSREARGFYDAQVIDRDRNGADTVQFVGPDSLGAASLAEMWDAVILEGRESDVVKALQIVEPRVTGVFFLSGQSRHRRGTDTSGILLGFEGQRQREPLGSHGDGMRRLLALSLSMVEASGGYLLIDEIDTGLHYSIMGEMWRFVIEAARQADVQVFATTHSQDCIRGLAWVCAHYPELQGDVALQKVDPRLDKAVVFDAQQLLTADEQDIEVR